MVARNDITGDSIQTKSTSSAYRDNYDNIWGKPNPREIEEAKLEEEEFERINKMQVRVQENVEDIGKCGCGRSPTGKCIGWHGLSEEAFQARLSEFKAQQEAANK
jgi:hypothetical protein